MNERKLASLWTRVLGGAIDVSILFVFTYVVCYVWTNNAIPSEAYLSYEASQSLWKSRFILTWLVSDLIYSAVLMTSDMQATLGQRAVGIKIVTDNGEKIGFGAAIGRNLMSILSSIFLKLGYAIATIRKDKKTLHDLVAGTVVIDYEDAKETTFDSIQTTPTTYSTSSYTRINEVKKIEREDSINHTTDKHSNPLPKMNSEIDTNKLWEIVADEFESESKKKGLYARCFSETNGDEPKTKALYYKIRFEELIQERKLSFAEAEIKQAKDSIESQPAGEGRNGRQALKDDECFINGYYKKFMLNGYECFDLDNGKAMVLTPKRKIIYKNLDALNKSMEEQAKTGTFTGALIEIYL